MASIPYRRSTMTLFSMPADAQSHRVRMVLAEKDVMVDIHDEDPLHKSEDFLSLNPYNALPTLVDRDLVLYDARVIMEYLDERFPHPPLLPVDPVTRARFRMVLHQIEQDWYSLLGDLENPESSKKAPAKARLQEALIEISPLFQSKSYFFGDELSLLDCSLAPILWRLPCYGLEFSGGLKTLQRYADRVFKRRTFQNSLSAAERKFR